MSIEAIERVLKHSKTRGPDRAIMLVLAYRASVYDRPEHDVPGEIQAGCQFVNEVFVYGGHKKTNPTQRRPVSSSIGPVPIMVENGRSTAKQVSCSARQNTLQAQSVNYIMLADRSKSLYSPGKGECYH